MNNLKGKSVLIDAVCSGNFRLVQYAIHSGQSNWEMVINS